MYDGCTKGKNLLFFFSNHMKCLKFYQFNDLSKLRLKPLVMTIMEIVMTRGLRFQEFGSSVNIVE